MVNIKEIKAEGMDTAEFIADKVKEISSLVADGLAINALSGGVDSACVTMLGHKALGERLKTYFIDNGLMREGEPENIISIFKKLGVRVELLDARDRKSVV
jgi:GMP synthase (glutamine-hydrolysing)